MEEITLKLERLALSNLGRTKQFAPAFLDEKSSTVFVIDIPDCSLESIEKVQVNARPRGRGAQSSREARSDPVDSVPKTAGCYWIYTDEPVNHCLNAAKKVPAKVGGFTVVYNGVTTNLQSRAKEHLLRDRGLYGEMSGIAVDLICQAPEEGRSSHAKCAWAPGGRKLPKLLSEGEYVRPACKDDVLRILNLTQKEKDYLGANDVVCFKNGINSRDPKHIRHQWFFCWVECPDDNLRGYIERKWREAHGVPVLCSYTNGR